MPEPIEHHLRLLSIFHYVVAGLVILFACIFIIHLVMGIVILAKPELLRDSRGQLPPRIVGVIFTVLGGLAVTAGWALGGCLIAAGRFIARRKKYMFCFVVAIISCIFSPFGTVLGVFTLIVLSRPSVKALFNYNQPRKP